MHNHGISQYISCKYQDIYQQSLYKRKRRKKGRSFNSREVAEMQKCKGFESGVVKVQVPGTSMYCCTDALYLGLVAPVQLDKVSW